MGLGSRGTIQRICGGFRQAERELFQEAVRGNFEVQTRPRLASAKSLRDVSGMSQFRRHSLSNSVSSPRIFYR